MKPGEMEKIIDGLIAENGFEEVVAYLLNYSEVRRQESIKEDSYTVALQWLMIRKCMDLAIDAMNSG